MKSTKVNELNELEKVNESKSQAVHPYSTGVAREPVDRVTVIACALGDRATAASELPKQPLSKTAPLAAPAVAQKRRGSPEN